MDALTERMARKAIEQRYRSLFRRQAHYLVARAEGGPDYLDCLSAAEWEELAELRATERRLDDGEVGVCESCGEPLSPETVRATPWVRECEHCCGGSVAIH